LLAEIVFLAFPSRAQHCPFPPEAGRLTSLARRAIGVICSPGLASEKRQEVDEARTLRAKIFRKKLLDTLEALDIIVGLFGEGSLSPRASVFEN
jgi:hypothetical protein